jgi:Tat protein translocase TatC
MTGPGAEMPFLEHLEELRVRLTRVLIVLIAGFAVGYWVVQQYHVVALLKEPIAPFLTTTNGKLVIQSPTEPVMIQLKLALIVGLILTSPIILYQVWAFLSPALYAREKKTVLPAAFVGLLLFIGGSLFAFFVLLPQALPILFSFQSEGLENLITFSEYFSFVTQLVLAMGLAFELPLVIIMLTALGVTSPASLSRFRRFAIVLAAVAGAVLSPGTDVLSMLMMTVPILLLYEIGYAGSWVIYRAKRRKEVAAAAVLLLLLAVAWPAEAMAQQPTRLAKPPGVGRDTTQADTLGADSLGRRPNQALDTAAARRLGLPTQPKQQFPPEDSVLTELLSRPGYQYTRFRSDSAVLFAGERRIQLRGAAMTKRGETILEADSIAYQEADCQINAIGNPALFDRETVLSGFGGIRYNTCIRRGIVTDALTSFKQGGSDWFLRGNLAQDSSSSRLYASKGEITSCDLPTPHYHFSAREVKWISKTIMVARPAVLYMRDVPVLWLPFVFQDARPGRRSGILIPRFGLNDIVRQNPGYNRQVTNIGYYWAPSEYFDATAKLDWYANRYVEYGAAAQYRILNRFLSGSIGYSRMSNSDGGRSTRIRWDHRQNFNISTSLNMSLDYSSDGTVRRDNAIDPLQSTQQISSQVNFQKRLSWGTLSLGGTRRQNLSDKSVTMSVPALSINPKPIDLARNVTWSPALSWNNNFETNFPINNVLAVRPGGVIDTVSATLDRRTTTVSLSTPLRIGGFNWSNSLGYNDRQTEGRTSINGVKIPDLSTPDPTDSIVVNRVTIGDFQSEVNWETGINLPTAFRGTWKLQPSVGITNTTSGPFLLRNANTNGDWVAQGKRFSFGVSSTPTFFGFFPGFGPLEKIRHSISPTFQYNYSPSADVPDDYARALVGPNGTPVFRSDQVQRLSLGLSQNFEGKMRKPASDTSAIDQSRKLRLLGISTSSIQYDFEQAKKPGRTGWLTDNLSNQLQSDLLPGFSLSLTHDLFRGPVGTDSATFSPFLQAVSASFGISGNTVKTVLGLVGIGKGGDSAAAKPPTSYVASQQQNGRPPSFYGANADQRVGYGTNRSFSANFNYSLSRTRPENGIRTDPQQSLGFSTAFAPTPFWTVSWSTQYNITDSRFESQTVRLERVLHEWRAGFNFVKNPNGNFAFYFSVYLSDLPDIKFDYNQTSIEREGRREAGMGNRRAE